MGRRIWVTGATGNMGKAVIEKFLASEDKVIGTLIPGEKAPVWPGQVQPELISLDLGDEKKVEEAIRLDIEKCGKIDVAVLTVGGFAAGDLRNTNAEGILKMINLNFITAFNSARPIFLQMIKQNYGRIFLVGARPGLSMADSKGIFAYGLSKSMIFRLAELLNAEAKGTEVVVSVLVPSTIDTPQNRKDMPDSVMVFRISVPVNCKKVSSAPFIYSLRRFIWWSSCSYWNRVAFRRE